MTFCGNQHYATFAVNSDYAMLYYTILYYVMLYYIITDHHYYADIL